MRKNKKAIALTDDGKHNLVKLTAMWYKTRQGKNNFDMNNQMNRQNLNLKVAVLAGGIGSEREVSLSSGKMITSALQGAGVDVISVDITPDDMGILDDTSFDVFFLALHGRFGEDGQIQEILEQKGLCFTGSDSRASRLAFDKAASKDIFRRAGVAVPDDIRLYSPVDATELAERIAELGKKFVVKPIMEGSSVGVEIIDKPKTAASAALKCLKEFGDCIIERFISGKEITVGLLNGRPLPIIEIRPRAEFYDYQAKYNDDATEYLFGTVEDKKTIDKINRDAVTCFKSLNCRHLGRVDMILDDSGTAYVLEINTLPGFTSHSLLPMAAAKAGIPAPQLCMEIIEAAMSAVPK